jgi:hypothetical protein
MRRPGYLSGYKCPRGKKRKFKFRKALGVLVRQAARWATAAKQDKNPMIAVLHANYGAGYLWALQDIATSSEIEQFTGIDWKKFRSGILGAQDEATRRMAKLCPKFAPKKSYLTKIAGEGN